MLKKFNKLITEIIESLENSTYNRRLRKCDELYNFNCKISDLPKEKQISLNNEINKYVKEALHGDMTGRSVRYRIFVIFYYDGKWYQRSNARCEEFDDEIATFYLSREYFKKDDNLEGEIKIPINDIIISSGGGTISTETVIKTETNKHFDEENVKKHKDSLSFPEEINVLINKGFIKKEEIINAFYHKKKGFYKSLNLKDIMADPDGESIIKNYFKVDTNDNKFEIAVRDSKLSVETMVHTHCIFLNLDVSILFDQSKELSDQEFPCEFKYKYIHSEPSEKPGF